MSQKWDQLVGGGNGRMPVTDLGTLISFYREKLDGMDEMDENVSN